MGVAGQFAGAGEGLLEHRILAGPGQQRAQHFLRALPGLDAALFEQDVGVGQDDRPMAGHPPQQGVVAAVGLGGPARARFGLAQGQGQPQVVRVPLQQVRQLGQGRGGLARHPGQGQAIALRVGQAAAAGTAHGLVLADGRVGRVGGQGAQPLLGPAELGTDLRLGRVQRVQPQAGRQQRVATAGRRRLYPRRIQALDPVATGRRAGGGHDGAALDLFGALAGLADAGGVDRVGAQVLGHRIAAVVAAHGHGHALEEAGHRIDVVAAARQGADAQAVGLRFVGTGVVDLVLLDQGQATGDGGLGGVAGGAAAGRLRGHDRRQHAQQDRHLVALGPLHPAQHVLLGDMGDLVREHGGHLVLAFGGQDQAGIHADVAAQGGEGVDLPVLEHEQGVGLFGPVAVGAEPGAHRLQPVVQQRVFQQVAVIAQLAQHHCAILGLFGRGQQFAGR